MGRAEQRACGEQPQECNGMLDIRTKIMEKARRQNTLARTDALSSLQTIETLANGLGRFPGVKQVVLFSEGYFIEEAKDVLANLAARAAQSNVRISALDARGLGRLNSVTPIDSMGSLNSPGDFGQIDTNEDVLTSMAIDTGGAFVNNANDLAPSLAAISAQASTYYVIGYAPTRPFDGAWRTISVRIKRPDVVVHARKGYVANAPPPESAGGAAGTGGAPPSTSGVPPSTSSNVPSTSSNASSTSSSVSPAPSTSSSVAPAPSTSSNAPSTSGDARSTSEAPPAVVDPRAQRDFQARAGLAAYARGDLETAQAELQRAVASGNAPTATRYRLGQVEYALAHYDTAADVLAGVVRDAPDFQAAYFDLADAYFSTNRFADAVRILREATRRWPKDSDAQNAYGVALTRRGALDDAIGAFQAAVTIEPNDGVSHYNLARAYHLRYLQAQRNAAQTAMRGMTSIGDEDRKRAIAEYTRYLQIGGPFDEHARDGLKALQWK
jgi:tetratricopeptide (TPR) repeat protein